MKYSTLALLTLICMGLICLMWWIPATKIVIMRYVHISLMILFLGIVSIILHIVAVFLAFSSGEIQEMINQGDTNGTKR